MFSEKMQEALNKQINAELYSSYLYLSMSAYFQSISLSGFANWMRVQAQEELAHGMRFYDYVNERGGRVILHKIDNPAESWESPINAFEHVLSHEQEVTGLINDLVDLSISERDHATKIFLQWFITEQIEEEANAADVLHKLKLTGGDGSGLFMLDRELAQRVFVMPTFGGQQ